MSEAIDLVPWLRAQLDEDEWWAREASRTSHGSTETGEHWRWECEDTDQPVTLDPVLSEYAEGHDGSSLGLRSVEEYPSSVGPLSHLVIHNQDEVRVVDAGHIARHDPARVLREVEAKRRILDEYEKALDRRRLFRDDVASAGALLQMVAVVKLLALPYSDRPGYRPEWRP